LPAADVRQLVKRLPAFLTLTVVPRYPAHPVVEHDALLSLLHDKTLSWRNVGFPRELTAIISQHESAIALRAVNELSLVESNVWGMLSYAACIGEEREQFTGIHTPQFVSLVLLFLKHAGRMMNAFKLTAPLQVEVLLQGVRGIPWLHFNWGFAQQGAQSHLDDRVAFTVDATTEALEHEPDRVAMDVLRLAFFAIGWPGTVNDPQKLADLVKVGYEYNNWRT
jgi:hypothetical protein